MRNIHLRQCYSIWLRWYNEVLVAVWGGNFVSLIKTFQISVPVLVMMWRIPFVKSSRHTLGSRYLIASLLMRLNYLATAEGSCTNRLCNWTKFPTYQLIHSCVTHSSEVTSRWQKCLRCSERGEEGAVITTRWTTTKQTQRRKMQTQTMTQYAKYNTDATQSQMQTQCRTRQISKELKQELRATAESLGLKWAQELGGNFVAFYCSTGC